MIIIEGNDGTGKSTLVESLRKLGYQVQDRGEITKMTDDSTIKINPDVLYFVLDATVDVCRQRLEKNGKDLNEKYHTVEDLTYYRQRFLDVAKEISNCIVIDAGQNSQVVFEQVVKKIIILRRGGNQCVKNIKQN